MERPGKVVLITGASSGLGEAAALACAAAGHRVALAARREERLDAVAQRIGRPEDTLTLRTDVRDPESIRAMVAQTEARFGQVDALLANAGLGYGEPLAEVSEEHLLEQVEVNLLAVIRCARAVLPGMLRRGSGHILTVASVAAEAPIAEMTVYAATKGGVASFSEGLYREVAPRGVHVSVIVPGFIRSEMTAMHDFPMPPASVFGALVVRLLRRPRRRAVVPRYYGAGIWFNRFFPGLTDRIAARISAELERRGRR